MQELVLTDSNGHEVSAVVSIPQNAKSVVIFSHGFGSSKNSSIYKEFEKEFNALGIGAVRYDYYGHGDLYCKDTKFSVTSDVTLSKAVASLQAVVSYVVNNGNYSIGLLGSSFGGLVSLIVSSQNSNIRALALKSPVVEPIQFWRNRLGELGLERWQKNGTMHYECFGEDYDLNFAFWQDLQKYDTLALAKHISCPTFIVHGDADTIVPVQQSEELAQILGMPVHFVKGAEHNYAEPSQHDEMKNLLVDFLRDAICK